MRHLVRAFAVALGLFGLAPFPALAGTTGVVWGRVTSHFHGSPLAGVRVTMTSMYDREQTRTDDRGYFRFLSLYPGMYTMVVGAPGFMTYARTPVQVASDAHLWRNIALYPEIKCQCVMYGMPTNPMIRTMPLDTDVTVFDASSVPNFGLQP